MKQSNLLFKVYPPAILLTVFSLVLSCQQTTVRTKPDGTISEISSISYKNPSGSKATSEIKMKAMIEQSIKIWNEGELVLIEKLYAAEYVRYHVDVSDKLVGLNAFKEHVTTVLTAYPNFTIRIDEILIKDDMSVTQWTFTGTNEGALGDIPPTGKKVQVSGVTIGRFFGGKITKEWVYWNNAALLEQLGYTFVPPGQNSRN